MLLAAGVAQAQQPTDGQRNAIRSSCRSDFMANCSNVTPGGKEALDCLRRNSEKLSAACQAAVSALTPAAPAPATPAAPPPPAASPAAPAPAASTTPAAPSSPPAKPHAPAPAASVSPPPAPVTAAVPPPSGGVIVLPPREALRIVRICSYDVRALCPGVPAGGGRIIACLMQNVPALSPLCRDTLSAAER